MGSVLNPAFFVLVTCSTILLPQTLSAQIFVPVVAGKSELTKSENDSSTSQRIFADAVDLAHAQACADDPFPSAKKCAKCHPTHFREWSVSPHAYAQLSPVFNAMSNSLMKFTSGTNGDFCIRCHTTVGMALNEPINLSNMQRHPTSREGVTCVSCHRINQAWGKGAGRQAMVPGDVTQVIYGPKGSAVLNEVLTQPDKYGTLKTDSNDDEVRGRKIHRQVGRFFEQTESGFCGACHDVFAPNGFRLEDAFSEFKADPAAKQFGQNCQDCHMGRVPGKAEGFDFGSAAIVGNAKSPPRKLTNHMMAGPDYSVIHRGLFPHHLTAIREENSADADSGLATMAEWLLFDDTAEWGTPEFEQAKPDNQLFPPPWDDPLMRRKARRILDEQHKLLAEATWQRFQVLRAGYCLGDIELERTRRKDFRFQVRVSNITLGHGVPTGFDAERVVFLRTLAWDGNGRLVFQSGDLDPNGDLRDSHSLYVHNGRLPQDRQLLNLQSRFLTRNIRGGEREQVLPVPFSLDPLPYFRPATRPFTVLGRPIAARKHKQNIEASGSRLARYRLSRNQLRGPGPYLIRVQLIAGMIPVNLVHAVSSVGFDFHMNAREIANEVVAGHLVLYEKTATVNLE